MGLRFPWRFGLRARILRAKLKHNISASTRNSISRREGGGGKVGPAWNSYIGRPQTSRRWLTPSPSWPHQFDRCLILLESFELHRRYSSVGYAFDSYIREHERSTEHHTGHGKGHEPWEGMACVCVWVFDRAISKLRGWIFSGHTSPVTWDFRTTDLRPVFFRGSQFLSSAIHLITS